MFNKLAVRPRPTSSASATVMWFRRSRLNQNLAPRRQNNHCQLLGGHRVRWQTKPPHRFAHFVVDPTDACRTVAEGPFGLKRRTRTGRLLLDPLQSGDRPICKPRDNCFQFDLRADVEMLANLREGPPISQQDASGQIPQQIVVAELRSPDRFSLLIPGCRAEGNP